MNDTLYAWSENDLVGVFRRNENDEVTFSYSDTWNRPISLSLPCGGEWDAAAPLNFLNGLLPDSSNERLRMADALEAKSDFCFDLLDAVDAIGGLVFSANDVCPMSDGSQLGASPVTKKDFISKIDQAQISSSLWWVHDEKCRFSLAGLKARTALSTGCIPRILRRASACPATISTMSRRSTSCGS